MEKSLLGTQVGLNDGSKCIGLSIQTLRELANQLLQELDVMGQSPPNFDESINIREEITRYEIELIRRALRCTGNHQARAARKLGIKPTTLNSKIKRHNIQS